MDAVEICPLTKRTIAKLIAVRHARAGGANVNGRRKAPRWPFPGTVELWIADEGGQEQLTLATSINLSLNGVGICIGEPLDLGLELPIAMHEPEASFHGRALVRHCTALDEGYYVGLKFLFDKE